MTNGSKKASRRKSARRVPVCEHERLIDGPDDPRKQPLVGNMTLERLDKLTAAGDKSLIEAEAHIAAVKKSRSQAPAASDIRGFMDTTAGTLLSPLSSRRACCDLGPFCGRPQDPLGHG